MLVLSIKLGQAVQLGEMAVIKVDEKPGGMVKMVFATEIWPIRILEDGQIPPRFTRGITGKQRIF